jgi:YHS domain-containing protein
MLRFLGLLIAFILVVPLIRMVVGVIGRAFSNFAFGTQTPQRRPPAQPPSAPGGALHKDPVCGTYVSAAVAVRLDSGGKTHYFCSTACRDKFSSA